MIELTLGSVYTFPVFAADDANTLMPVKIDHVTPKRSKSVKVEIGENRRSVTLIPLAITRRAVKVRVVFDNMPPAHIQVSIRG